MFFILLILIILGITLWNAKLQLKIHNLDIATDRTETIKRDFEVYLGIVIFNKIEILKINLKKVKSQKISFGKVLEQAKKLEEKSNKQSALKGLIKSLKDLEFEIQKIDLKVEVGTEDAALTAILVGTIAGILGIILRNQKFKILPIYQDKNVLKIKLDGIFRVNLMHYIYKTISKGRDANDRKSSNRRSYAYSNE